MGTSAESALELDLVIDFEWEKIEWPYGSCYVYGGHHGHGWVRGKHLFIIDAEKNLDEARRESYWTYFSTFYI